MAVFRPTNQEAQTAAGVRSSRYLPKTARRAPQALEAGAFWDHQPKSLSKLAPSAHCQVFPPVALKSLAIQQIWLRFFALQEVRIPANPAHQEIPNRLLEPWHPAANRV